MYPVSETWEDIMGNESHWFECKVVVNGITIPEDKIMSMKTSLREFSTEFPSVGSALSSELEVTVFRPDEDIPRMALVEPYVRCAASVTSRGTVAGIAVAGESVVGVASVYDTIVSEWIPQGKYYIDTREYTRNDDDLDLMTLHCFDAMLKTEDFYPSTTHDWDNFTDEDVVEEIAATIGVEVDDRTWDFMGSGYTISAPVGYTMREVLSYIAAMYAGNWVMNYDGELLLVGLDSMPPETSYLVDNAGDVLTFGVFQAGDEEEVWINV